jgi:membrane-associated protein
MFNVTHLIQSGGLELLGLFLFAEVGLFLGFFLPGDTLLIAAGVYAKEGKISFAGVLIVAAVAAIAGDNLAYFIGNKLGRKVFTRKNSVLFDPKHVATAEKFYQRFGSKIVLVSHFLPIVRTLTPLIAGVASMKYKLFLMLDAIGDTVWAILIAMLGYYVVSHIPKIDTYLQVAVIAVVVLSATPTIIQFFRMRSKQKTNTGQ